MEPRGEKLVDPLHKSPHHCSSVGFSWVHGTDIGIASSIDGGQTWLYRGTVSGLDHEHGRNTFWAPEVLCHDGIYHMYVSYVKGIPTTWEHERNIIHYTSMNLWDWKFESILNISSNKVIDACVFQFSNGVFRMWYKDEADHSSTYAADSTDLYHWDVVGPTITEIPHEGPNVFHWKGCYWLIADFWSGLMVFRSEDGTHWVRQQNILDKPGSRKDDNAVGHHADVLTQGDDAYIFYFTHPDEESKTSASSNAAESRRSSLQVAKLELVNDHLICNRDCQFDFHLNQGE